MRKRSTSFLTILRFETSNDIPLNPKISVKCVKRGTASTRIVSVVLALNNILRNSFFYYKVTLFVCLPWCKWCTYFVRFHSVLLQAVNGSICLNDEGKYCENESACLNMPLTWHHIPAYSAPPKMRILCCPRNYPWVVVRAKKGGGGGGYLACLRIRVGPKEYTHKKSCIPLKITK